MSQLPFDTNPRGSRNALRNNVRLKAIPPGYNKERSDWLCLHKYAKKCRNKAKGFDDFAAKLKAKFKVTRDYARKLYYDAADYYL